MRREATSAVVAMFTTWLPALSLKIAAVSSPGRGAALPNLLAVQLLEVSVPSQMLTPSAAEKVTYSPVSAMEKSAFR